ncbi:hypothetical protein KP509_07G036500 [Ceratopteris richardii]|uniref:Uncharacterized protein n=1 Tax=Ceratopteris richardii TaxID=49495 RepID=A0A8T2UGV2_CERRI|nr:hypothetical protein KP509_07G036500 [Ceratopteris richardii]
MATLSFSSISFASFSSLSFASFFLAAGISTLYNENSQPLLCPISLAAKMKKVLSLWRVQINPRRKILKELEKRYVRSQRNEYESLN